MNLAFKSLRKSNLQAKEVSSKNVISFNSYMILTLFYNN